MRDDRQGWIERFEGLSRLSPELRATLQRGARVIIAPAGTRIFEPGMQADHLLLLLDGVVRVQQTSDTGREMLLYRIQAGESCVLTTACMLGYEAYSAEGIAETDITAVAIPRGTFDDLVARSPEFREFVFRAYSRRITDLFTLIDQIVFQRMDVRLASRLLELGGSDGMIKATHQVMAAELGTAREVVSRTLADFQRRGWVEQGRGEIRVVNPGALERLARTGGA